MVAPIAVIYRAWIYLYLLVRFIYLCVFCVIDLSIHTGMRFCIGINVKVLCIYKYRFRFVVGRIECNDVTETGESRSVSILFHLT